MLYLYNSFTKKKEEFKTISKSKVKIYVCGMTVYDYCHIGHARVLIVFDLIVNWLQKIGYEVTYVRNITDIDDKIIKKSLDEKIDVMELTNKYICYMHHDSQKLLLTPPDFEPKATENITEMITIISDLIKKNIAYTSENGDVYFSVEKFNDYGKLSGKTLESLMIGKRVEKNLGKKNFNDFVLWKRKKADEPYWKAPFGEGRPGWHIECSAMSMKYLGPNFDIHGGGLDLQFPHHENEIAQSESFSQQKFANYWIHNGFVQIGNEKMSKSIGNTVLIKDLLKSFHPEVIKYFMIKTHYRSPITFTISQLSDSKIGLDKLYFCFRKFNFDFSQQINMENNSYTNRFYNAMNDDFNSPLAISVLHEVVGEIFRTKNKKLLNTLYLLTTGLGLLKTTPEDYFTWLPEGFRFSRDEIENLIEKRLIYKKKKEFQEADNIRTILSQESIVLDDISSDSTLWRYDLS